MVSPSLDGILKECPRFRILTSGKAGVPEYFHLLEISCSSIEQSGVGKTTLIKATFNIDHLQASDKLRGICDVEDEITSSQNSLFVLHDSQGFEASEVDNFNKVKAFVDRRAREPEIKDRLHAIWHCIQIPHTGGRLIEAGDEDFLRLSFGDLPVIIVFTQYDRLHDQLYYDLTQAGKLENMDEDQKKQRIEEESDKHFQEACVKVLDTISPRPKCLKWVRVSNQPNHRDTLQILIKVTEELIRNHVRESAWIVMAGAQRVDSDRKVESCIAVGMRKYWRGLAAGTYFANRRLDACISAIHRDIVGIWNFRDDDEILQRPSFQNAVLLLVQDLADPDGPSPGSEIQKNLDAIKSALDVATPLSGPLAPIVASIGLSAMFVKWLSDMYHSTPGVLRCLMGYIVDITIVLEILFWLKLAQPQLPSLFEDDVFAAFSRYQGSADHVEVHKQIRRYVDNMTLMDYANPEDHTHVEVEQLIRSHRHTLVDAILKDTGDAQSMTKPPAKNLDAESSQPSKTFSNAVPDTIAVKVDQKHIAKGSGTSVSPENSSKSGWFSRFKKSRRRS